MPVPPNPPVLRWLHISDLHLREGEAWSQDRVLSSMLEDIASRYSGMNSPDLIFVTGDIAFSGKRAEYELAERFLGELMRRTSLQRERVFLVPGNHDVDRDLGQDTLEGARARIKSVLEVDRFFDYEPRRRELYSRQSAFREFASRVSNAGGTYGAADFAHFASCEVGLIRVRVLLIDSAWLANGGDDDRGHLVVGQRQIGACALGLSREESGITFALMHHPFAWLAEFDAQGVENQVIELADICLRGHVHSEDLRTLVTQASRLPIFTAGAAFVTRDSENCYHLCSLDLSTSTGSVVSHRYRQVENRWVRVDPEEWNMASPGGEPCSVECAIRVAQEQRASHPSFLACLLSGLSSDVPVVLPDGRLSFVMFATDIPGVVNRLGAAVQTLRHHLYWQSALAPSAWSTVTQDLVREWNQSIVALGPVAANEIKQREERSLALLTATSGGDAGGSESNVVVALRALLSGGDLVQSRALLERWRVDSALRSEERRSLQRFEVELVNAEGDHEGAWTLASQVLSSGEPTSADFALASACAYSTSRMLEAARLMHQALDRGAPPEAVAALARQIAGQTGDAGLAKRVRQ